MKIITRILFSALQRALTDQRVIVITGQRRVGKTTAARWLLDQAPTDNVAWRARVTGGMAGSLFLRSFERSDRIYAAMAARGYDGEVRAFPLPPIAPVSWVVLVGGLSLLGLLTLLGYLFWG